MIALALSASADDPPAANPSPAIQEATRHARELQMKAADPSRNEELKLTERPLLTFGDAARSNEGGTLWAWSSGGRPVAMMELFHETGSDKPWVHAMTMTSPTLIRLIFPGGAGWTPRESDFQLVKLPDAGPARSDVDKREHFVAESAAMRLRQMKDYSRRFTAHEFWDPNNSRFELRLLTQPVHRYSDATNKIVDGTCFVLAHGTNPEALLFIEAIGNDVATAKWHYALSRLGSADIHVELDKSEVWRRDRTPGVVGAPVDSYWLFSTQREKD